VVVREKISNSSAGNQTVSVVHSEKWLLALRLLYDAESADAAIQRGIRYGRINKERDGKRQP
jgi:hypothetical protein